MAQSTSTELPLNHLAEAPAQISTLITTIHRHPITSPGEIPTNAFLPLNPVLTIPAPGPAVMSVINALSTLHPDTPASHGNAPATTEDKNDIWRAMIKTFDNLYRGLAEDNIRTPDETSSTITPNPSNDNITNPERVPVPDDQRVPELVLKTIPLRLPQNCRHRLNKRPHYILCRPRRGHPTTITRGYGAISRQKPNIRRLHLRLLLGRSHSRFQRTYMGDGTHRRPTATALTDAIQVIDRVLTGIGTRQPDTNFGRRRLRPTRANR